MPASVLRRGALAALALALLVVLALAVVAPAATPPSQTVAVPATAGQTRTITWTGTIPPGSNPTSDCSNTVLTDDELVKLQVAAGTYDTVDAKFTFKISWTPSSPGGASTSDEILTVNGPNGQVGSSDSSGTSEVVNADNLKAGDYTASACGFVNAAPQDYTGTLIITTAAKDAEPSLPAADPQGLSFSATVPADNQRDVSEPLMEIDPSGRIYTCGPTGFSNASDYAQVSTDGGDQFHLLGTPPRGQQGVGGGGDCALGTGTEKNSGGSYQYAYAGLGPLTGFTTSTSPDGGRTIVNGGPQGNGTAGESVGADRQWITFLDNKTALLSYNGQQPRQIEVQKSTNGGLTYSLGTNAGSNPDFPGPMRTLPASLNPAGAGHGRAAYFAWTASDADFSYVNLAISTDGGSTFKDCTVVKEKTTDFGALQAFAVADNDSAGNIYVAFSDQKNFHTYLASLTHDKLDKCTGAPTTAPATLPQPGALAPVQVDRGAVRTTVFPWLVAGGEPGRVAVGFYGTDTQGDPNPGDFKASWYVYVNQSLDALTATPAFSQVRASSHPFHYDSVCLKGLGCSTTVPAGDRSLGDFFALDYNPQTKKVSVVYSETNKRPGDAAGFVSTPAVTTQNGGPSLGGGTLPASPRRTLRADSADPSGDALVNFSNLSVGVPVPPGAASNEKAMDFLDAKVGAEIDPATGKLVKDGGFTVTMKLADLRAGALSRAMSDTKSQSLLWVFRFQNGYRASATSARYSPANGFTFGYNDYRNDTAGCGGGKCVIYPGGTRIKGKVDQARGTLVLSVPRSVLRELAGPTGNGERPRLSKAVVGSRFYDAAAFSLGNTVSADQTEQSFLYPADNTPAMDFLLPAIPGSTPPGGGPPPKACRDRIPPTTRFSRAQISRRGLRLAGRSSDRGCKNSRVKRVEVSVARQVRHHRCRYLRNNGTFSPPQSCRQRLRYLRPAHGTTRWTDNRKLRLPRAAYIIRVRGVDAAGNRARPSDRATARRRVR